MYSDYYDDIDMHTETLERCRRAHNYRVIEIHIPGIQGPGVSSGGSGSSDDDTATDEDIEDLFPGGTDKPTPTPPADEGEDDDGYATDEDIKDLFP